MGFEDVKVNYDEKNKSLSVEIPMTQPTGKVRVKKRNCFSNYGIPIAVKQNTITNDCYIEWQIGYDIHEKDKSKTTLLNYSFSNNKKETKYPYELCEILFYSYKMSYLSREEIEETFEKMKSVKKEDTFESREDMSISRTNPNEISINDLKFYKMKVSYPLLVHIFNGYEILSEIVIKEKQRAVGVQAMLYLCIPITKLNFDTKVIGRSLKTKEKGTWCIGEAEARLSLELISVFCMLSEKHRYDVIAIMKKLFDFLD